MFALFLVLFLTLDVCKCNQGEELMHVTRGKIEELGYTNETQVLDLCTKRSYGVVGSIDEDAFEGLDNLTSIQLCLNSSSTLPDFLFRNVTQLKMLSISGLCDFRVPVFVELKERLEELTLVTRTNSSECKRDSIFDSATREGLFLSLKKLKLKLNRNKDVHEMLQSIHFERLEELDITGNSITSLEVSVFDTLTNLKRLDVGENSLVSVDGCLLKGLTALETLSFSSNKIESLHQLPVLPKLVTLQLDNNEIAKFEVKLRRNFKKLMILDLKGNRLATLPGDLLREANDLVKLDLSINRFGDVPSTVYMSRLPSLKYLDLSSNRIAAIDQDLPANEKLEELYLQRNLIKHIIPSALNALKNLRILDLSFNQLVDMDVNLFSSTKALNHLNLYDNLLISLAPGLFSQLEALETVTLAENSIQNLDDSTLFQNTSQLKVLDMSSNKLVSLNVSLFLNLKEIERIDLNSNNLTTIQPLMFRGLKRLVYLGIANNPLREPINEMEFRMATFGRLKEISL